MSLTVTKPAGVVAGDVLIAGFVMNSTTVVITPPSGWVLVTSVLNVTSVRTNVYRKLAGGSESVAYAFGFSFNTKAGVGVVAYSGVDLTTPVEVFGSGTNASLTAQLAPSVTTTSANTRVVRVWGIKKEASFTPPGRGCHEPANSSTQG
jgi:MSHA biogenesis protein MshQ